MAPYYFQGATFTNYELRITNHDSHQLALTISASLTEINPVSPDFRTGLPGLLRGGW